MGLIGFCGAQSFNMTIHDCALQYSAASHCSDVSLESWNCSHCLPLPGFVVTDIAYDSLDSILGFIGVAVANSTVVVSFRGSIDDDNWLEDIDFLQVPLPGAPEGVLVHQGFLDTYRSVRKRVLNAVMQAKLAYPRNSNNLLVTGHSLGAALAALCTLDLHMQNITGSFESVWMYNYGQPRVGNPAYASFYQSLVNGPNFRVINKRDPVPHLPPQDIFGRIYQHAPIEVWYHGDPAYYEICVGGEDPNCSDGVRDWAFWDHPTYMGVEMGC